MIYVSSASVRNTFMRDSIIELATAGILNIELSGGTQPYPELENDLLYLKEKYNLNYLCHNYFPPPKKPFVLNLASLDNSIHDATLENLKKALAISTKLGSARFGFHAGYLFNIPLEQIGVSIDKQSLFDRESAKTRFIKSFKILQEAYPDIKLYIENNVLSNKNYQNFKGTNPFFICSKEEYLEFKQQIDFTLLLDVAHLKVSCNTLGLSFKEELLFLINETDYIHISDNNAKVDSNNYLTKNSELFQLLSECDLNNKTITIEVYDSLKKVKESINLINNLVNE